VPRGRAFGKPVQDQRLVTLDARKHAFRHLPPFAICEDTSVRDDWIVEQTIRIASKSAQPDGRSAPDVNGAQGGEDIPLKLLSRPRTKRGWNDQHSPLERRAALVGFVGTMPEYYDFIIYGAAAALIFPEILFVNLGATTATMLPLLSFGIGFVARPFGAIIIGHYGDQLGRKTVLLFTQCLMGGSTLAIGLLPDANTIGHAAP
jgi:hypothetical protein